MNAMKKLLLTSLCLMSLQPAFAVTPASSLARSARSNRLLASRPGTDRYARRCQGHAPERGLMPGATLLWGTKRAWSSEQRTDERQSVLVSVSAVPLRPADGQPKAVWLERGRLVATPKAPGNLVGTVLQGISSDGRPVDVAICGAEPSPEDPAMHWYRIEAWNPVAREWENPCASTGTVPDPRALAVRGVWDSSGARHDVPGKLTLACESGAISQCIRWGYKPWAERAGKSLADLHQACTRMARADYCGNGRSHTQEHTLIDMYDGFGVQSRTTESSAAWNTERASFEAAWAPDGAACLARTRDGRALEDVLQECPGRFHPGEAEMGGGDRCMVRRQGMHPDTVLLRNRSYAAGGHTGRSISDE
ncbi:ADYC domain-containing protein [Myxococcus sp. RHSTA-1-4]|uniref:ADYC domain-containing protein n=1 Tax=Myxococcus sp. RHSTA-1-4 TaxID=2874601 RepID=UPI001CBF4D72|nr:ADYC domain-containing protein [Myxococcus sp. RHSTA-1-4]MBZ4416035.1 hypothetical protein [Myxococcus sp. RHSTA-1-4]